MTPISTRALHRLAVIAALMAALGVAGCGRKGALDPPPGASADPAMNVSPANAEDPTLLGSVSNRPSAAPVAPKGPDRRIPLDVLLD